MHADDVIPHGEICPIYSSPLITSRKLTRLPIQPSRQKLLIFDNEIRKQVSSIPHGRPSTMLIRFCAKPRRNLKSRISTSPCDPILDPVTPKRRAALLREGLALLDSTLKVVQGLKHNQAEVEPACRLINTFFFSFHRGPPLRFLEDEAHLIILQVSDACIGNV